MARPRLAASVKARAGTLRQGRDAPATAADAARHEWERLAPIVAELGTVSAADLRAFELLCCTLATAGEAEATVRQEGMTMPTGGGGVRSHPAVKVMEQARAQAARLLAEFGLTPRGRNYVSRAPVANPSDGASKFFT